MCRSHLCVVPFPARMLTLKLLAPANNDLHIIKEPEGTA